MSAEDIYEDPRARLLEIARHAVGLSYGPATRDAYVAALFDDEPTRGLEMARTMSSCGLFARACWRAYGLTDKRLCAPYKPGRVDQDLEAMAHEASAWRQPSALDQVQPADVVLIKNPEHVLVVEAVGHVDGADAGLDVVTSIDGGQRDDGGQWAIKRRVRHVGAGPSLDGRPVYGWIDWSAIVAHFG